MSPYLLFAVLLFVCGSSFAKIDYDNEWESFKFKYNKTYISFEEESVRKSIFINNKLFYSEPDHPNKSYNTDVNILADINVHELHCDLDTDLSYTTDTRYYNHISSNNKNYKYKYENLPSEFDWRHYDAVSEVKYQERCGSCWAFAATAVLESMEIILHQRSMEIDLSEQNLIDCDPNSNGCSGGLSYYAFEYVKNSKGIDTESYYPYKARDGECQFSESNSIKEGNFEINMLPMETEDLKTRLVYYGPVVASIGVTRSFKEYVGGIFNDPYCTFDSTSRHAIVIIGFGEENGVPYWTIKNSWGNWWGENGYGKIAMDGNVCGIKNRISFPDFLE